MAWPRRSGRQNGEIPVNFTKQISFYCVYLHQIHTTFCKITIKFCRRGDGGGAGLGGFANPRRLESCGPVQAQAWTSGDGKTEMDGASEMNRPSEEPAVTPTGCVMSRLSASGPHRSSLWRRLRPRDNAATLLRGARACLALLAAAALLALAAPAQAQTEIWSATLTPGDLRLSILGCGNHIDSARCSSTTVLSEDSFNYDSTDYTITMLFVRSGRRFELQVDADITTNTNALTLVVGSTSLVLAEATTSTARLRTWDNSGVSMTAGTDIAVKLTTTTTTTTNTAPTSADEHPEAEEDFDYTFSSDDFAFTDTDTGDSLASVKIVTLPASGTGTLTLSGTAIGSGDLPKTVPAAEIDDLKYSPPANLYGTDVASFTFKVNDGTVDSDNAYTMTIDVKGEDDQATGKPGITGTAQVGQALTATVGTIADLDGLPDPLFSAALTTIQWIQVDGATETDISGATSETYTLATADEGKKIKVKVWFEDDDGTAEGPLTSDAYPASGTVTAPVTNTAPTAANNTVTTGEDRAYTFDGGPTSASWMLTAGAALASVKIVNPAGAGQLPGARRHGRSWRTASSRRPRSTETCSPSGPRINAHGVAYTTFTFKRERRHASTAPTPTR